MPCREDPLPLDNSEETIDGLTRMLCSLCKLCESSGNHILIMNSGRELREWWEDHKRKDARRERKKQEKARKILERKQVIDSLTPEQRKILGYKQ